MCFAEDLMTAYGRVEDSQEYKGPAVRAELAQKQTGKAAIAIDGASRQAGIAIDGSSRQALHAVMLLGQADDATMPATCENRDTSIHKEGDLVWGKQECD